VKVNSIDSLNSKDVEWKNDKLCQVGNIPSKTCSQLLSLSESVKEMFTKNEIPFYILHGENDEISKSETMREVYKKSKVDEGMKQIVIIPGLKHDLLHESEDIREGLIEDIIDWIKAIQE
jgi:alpha-beta hydrolase superfamily lysophospholipase